MQDMTRPLSDEIVEPLRRARPWMKFIAIMGFVAFGIVVLDALFVLFGAGMSFHTKASQSLPAGLMILVGLFYIVVGFFFYFMPPLLLMKSALVLDRIESKGTVATLAEASERQRRFWKYCGIPIIVGLCVFVVFAIAAAIAIPILAAHHMR